MLKDMYGIEELTMQDLALIGQYSENNFNGMNCGIMDQFASAMAKKTARSSWIPAPWSTSTHPVKLKDARIVITNSKGEAQPGRFRLQRQAE